MTVLGSQLVATKKAEVAMLRGGIPLLPEPQPNWNYVVKRCFFPSHGRLSRRVNHRLEGGQQFIGFIPSFWWGPLCAFLVYAKPERERPGLGLG
jgi:hypothetical protein